MDLLSYIIWNADPEIFAIGERSIRWYGLLFAGGFLLSQQILIRMFKKEVPLDAVHQKQAEKDVETLTVYLVIATIVGARLGHVLFYEPDKYLANPVDILKIWEGGLASHGAAIAIILGMWLFARKRAKDWTFLKVADRIVVVVALVGCLIRFGNMMNSEIYGYPTKSSYGVVYTRAATDAILSSGSPVVNVSYEKLSKEQEGDRVPLDVHLRFETGTDSTAIKIYIENRLSQIFNGRYPYISDHVTFDYGAPFQYTIEGTTAVLRMQGIPRHPTQIYESLTSLLLFFVLFAVWNKYKENTPQGLLFGLFLVILWSFRFIHEFFKENQVSFEDEIPLNMGQWLSIPLVVVGIVILARALRQGTGSNPSPPQG